MHIPIIITLVVLLVALICTCLYLYQYMRRKAVFIDAPESAVVILPHWCAKVRKGSDLDRLHYELRTGIAVLEKRRYNRPAVVF